MEEENKIKNYEMNIKENNENIFKLKKVKEQ